MNNSASLMTHRSIIAHILLLLIISGCASTNTKEKEFRHAYTYSFTKEMDEPSIRGKLSRTSPEGYNVSERYSVSKKNDYIVYSASNEPMHSGNHRDDKSVLWKQKVSGGMPVKLTSETGYPTTSPSFSATDSHIVYASIGKLWKIRSDGKGGRARLQGTGMYDFAPQVSANNQIAFCSTQLITQASNTTKTNYFIWLCDLDGLGLTQMREGLWPSWSPDGSTLAFVHRGDIWTMTVDGSELKQITDSQHIFESLPSFSPDGKKLIFTSDEGESGKIKKRGDLNVWTVNLDSGTKTQITQLNSWDSWPVWAKDKILFLSSRGCGKDKYQRIWSLKI